MSSEVHVYELIDPRNDQRFYIDVTNNEGRRLEEHEGTECASTRKVVEDLRASGLKPKMSRLATCPSRDLALELEAVLIDHHKKKPDASYRWRQRAAVRPARQGAPWSDADETVFKEAQAAGKTVREIAAALQRSRGAVRSRLNKMGGAKRPKA